MEGEAGAYMTLHPESRRCGGRGWCLYDAASRQQAVWRERLVPIWRCLQTAGGVEGEAGAYMALPPDSRRCGGRGWCLYDAASRQQVVSLELVDCPPRSTSHSLGL